MRFEDYIPDWEGDEDRPLDIDNPRRMRFDLDSDDQTATLYAITQGEHADAYETMMLDYDEDAEEASVVVAPAETSNDPGDAFASGYGVFHDLNRGRLPRQMIGDKLYKQRYGGSAPKKQKSDSSTPKDVLEHVAGEGIYDWAKKAAS